MSADYAQTPVVRGREMLIFRVGSERFATPLAEVDEAVDLAAEAVQPLPDDNPSLRGVFAHRGALVPLFAPRQVLGVRVEEGGTALVIRAGRNGARAAVAVDDVEDVLTFADDELRAAGGIGEKDAVLRGVVQRGQAIIAIVDLNALVSACRANDGEERK